MKIILVLALLGSTAGIATVEDSKLGKRDYGELTKIESFRSLKERFGEPQRKVTRGDGNVQYFYSLNEALGGMVSGFTVIVREDVIVFKGETYRYSPIVNSDGLAFAELPGGEHWKISFSEYIEKTRVVVPLHEFGASETNALRDAILIPGSILKPENLKGPIHTECALLQLLKSRYPEEFNDIGKTISGAELIEKLKRTVKR